MVKIFSYIFKMFPESEQTFLVLLFRKSKNQNASEDTSSISMVYHPGVAFFFSFYKDGVVCKRPSPSPIFIDQSITYTTI